MTYPESVEATLQRYLSFYRTIQQRQFSLPTQPIPIVIMVSHGNSVQSFMEVGDPDARKKDLIGIGYCCVSIARQMSDHSWHSDMLADATHSGCGTSEVIPNEYYDE